MEKGLVQFTDPSRSVTHQELVGNNWQHAISSPCVKHVLLNMKDNKCLLTAKEKGLISMH